MAQAKINSLKYVIVNERNERAGTERRGNYYIDSKATVQSIFNSMDDVKRIKAENKRLRKRNQEITVAFSSLNADYETLRQKANSYAKAFEQEVGAKRTVAKKIVQVPKRSGSSGVFYTIQEKRTPIHILFQIGSEQHFSVKSIAISKNICTFANTNGQKHKRWQ